jgi:hypothetical protein
LVPRYQNETVKNDNLRIDSGYTFFLFPPRYLYHNNKMPTIKVPQQYEAALQEGLEEFTRTTGLSLCRSERIRTGDKDIAEETKKSYRKHYDGLYVFAAMIGAYGTCFALSYNAPTDFCPSADDNVVALYIMYKTQPEGTVLMRKDRENTE